MNVLGTGFCLDIFSVVSGICSSRIAGSYDNSKFNSLRQCLW